MARNTLPIGIIEINTDIVEKDRTFPKAYAFSITLSDKPDYLWKRYFEDEWKNSDYAMKRQIKVTGNKLRVIFEFGDNVREHAKFAQKLVEATNQRIE